MLRLGIDLASGEEETQKVRIDMKKILGIVIARLPSHPSSSFSISIRSVLF
jgi:hypothetical protein